MVETLIGFSAWNLFRNTDHNNVAEALDDSIKRLQCGYLDLYLVLYCSKKFPWYTVDQFSEAEHRELDRLSPQISIPKM